MPYNIIIYPPGEKRNVVFEFYAKLSKNTRNKILRQINNLEIYGLRGEVTDIKKLKGYNIWEIRILGKDNIRMFAVAKQQDIYILHIFRKKSQSTPISAIILTRRRAKLLAIDD